MRIIAGVHKAKRLATPETRSVRPTSDRVREAIFNVLEHGIDGFALAGVRVLDLFAGTGALGLEALSRGASFCLFVEEAASVRGLIRRNVEALSATGATKIFRRDATRLGEAGRVGRFSLVFADPPYGKGLGETALASLIEGGWLEPGAVIVLEEDANAEVAIPAGLTEIGRRTYGDTQVVFLKAAAAVTDARTDAPDRQA